MKYICNTYKPKFIVLHFGTIAIHYARIIKRTVPNIPIINIINLIPATIVVSRKVYLQYSLWLEYLAYKNLLPGIDGLVYSSKLMADTVAKKFQNITERTIVLPDYLPLSFNASNTIRYNQDEDSSVSLIFLGAPERWGNQIDDIDKEFMDIAERKIHVYSAEMSEKVVATGYGHIYPRFKNEDVFNGKLALYASGFSAALITYSAEMIQINERFRSTYPTRFFTAITAGIPIAVCNGLNDCGIFIEKYGIGFVYRDVEELIIKIKDKTKMISYRYNALVLRDAINAEAQSEKISKFVNTIIN